MKKTNFLKLVLTLVMAFAISGAFAQTPIPGEDDGAAGSNYVSTATQASTQVTEGKTIPLYAYPDTYFHPSYDPVAGTGITAGHTWTWAASGAEITLGGAAANYVEVTGVTIGTGYSVTVYESSPSCSDATTESITIDVLDQPSVSITTPAAAIYEDCVGGGTLPAVSVLATVTDNSSTNYRLVWDLEIYTEDNTGTADEWFDTDGTSLGGAQAFAEQYTQAAPQTGIAAPGDVDITSVAGWALQGLGTKTTVYIFTVRAINDLVSRRGDFLTIDGSGDVNATSPSDFMYYDVNGDNPLAATESVTITVHPAPVTGPIYHIDNAWGI